MEPELVLRLRKEETEHPMDYQTAVVSTHEYAKTVVQAVVRVREVKKLVEAHWQTRESLYWAHTIRGVYLLQVVALMCDKIEELLQEGFRNVDMNTCRSCNCSKCAAEYEERTKKAAEHAARTVKTDAEALEAKALRDIARAQEAVLKGGAR